MPKRIGRETVTVVFRLEKELKEAVQEVARRKQITVSEAMRDAVMSYLASTTDNTVFQCTRTTDSDNQCKLPF